MKKKQAKPCPVLGTSVSIRMSFSLEGGRGSRISSRGTFLLSAKVQSLRSWIQSQSQNLGGHPVWLQ